MTLSHLESFLDDEKKAEVGRRKMLLRSLTAQLRREHMRTAMLLSDCARLNSTLLRGILEPGNARTTTYGSDGAARSQGGSVFVSMEL
jgi:flagellar biosynthesis/type III secretory pathway chaperone